jgi:tetratricopeptide (TPR) repeat protein
MIYSDVVRNAELRVAQHYVQQLQRTRKQIEAGNTQALTSLDQDLVQIRHWQARLAEAAIQGVDCDSVLMQFGLHLLMGYQPFDEQAQWIETGLAAARRLGDKTSETNLLCDLSYVLMRQGEMVAARAAAEQALALAKMLKSKVLQSRVILRLGQVMTDTGEFEKARRYLQRALDLGELNSKSRIKINTWLGYIAYYENDFDQSAAYIDENIHLSRSLGDLSELATALVNRGMTYIEAERGEEGIPLIRESIALQRKLGEKHLIGHSLQTLSGYYIRIGALTEAEPYAQEHLKMAQEIESPLEAVWARTYLAAINRERGEYTQAHELLMQDAAFVAQSDSLTTRLIYEHTLASVLLRMGAYDEAQQLCERLLTEESPLLGVNEIVDLYDFLGQMALVANQPTAAIQHWQNGLAASSNQYAQQIGLYSAIAQTHLLNGQLDQARAALNAAQQIANILPNASGFSQSAVMCAGQAQLALKEGRMNQGRELLCSTLRQIQRLEVVRPRLNVLLVCAAYLTTRGDAHGVQVMAVLSNQPDSVHQGQLYSELKNQLMAQIDPSDWEQQWQNGLTRTLDQTIAELLLLWCSPAA